MSVVDRLPPTVWPDEKNLGGAHLALRYVSVPVSLAVALVTAAGLLPLATWAVSPVVAGTLFAAGISLLEARTRTCPGYAVLGLNTCPLPEAPDDTGPMTGGEGAA